MYATTSLVLRIKTEGRDFFGILIFTWSPCLFRLVEGRELGSTEEYYHHLLKALASYTVTTVLPSYIC